MAGRLRYSMEKYRGQQRADVIGPDLEPRGALLLWHGRIPNDRQVLRTLAVGLAHRGIVSIVPDFGCDDDDGGLEDLTASIEAFQMLTTDSGILSTAIGGWSYGARLAAAYALEHPDQFSRCIGFDGRYSEEYTPVASARPTDLVGRGDPVDFMLVRGSEESVVPPEYSIEFARLLTEAGHTCVAHLDYPTDHAGVVCARFDPGSGLCVPILSADLTSFHHQLLDRAADFIAHGSHVSQVNAN